ncbi:PREDICTED: cell cycle checkpoint protein RAD17 [Ceratosolen solmsi marchali]|uniref:Cell cycle checkpoint protein RAD17 n=1 Tax=Ceratosolen solmsi marchali TaxID=326594 RepID=A0AAJ6YET0_9HYME|nr:PREDICTED: cell cycle checkpoint protein RAD17 [Ceratosolen solmsi marchali]
MSRSKRNASSWLRSSFDFDAFDEDFSKKKCISDFIEDKNKETDFTYHNANVLQKKKNNLSALLSTCAPQKSSELAVSRQKQQEISRWFDNKVQKGKPSILIISGPSGCGKTEALKVIAKEHNFDVIEWITPIDQVTNENTDEIVRQGEIFEDFLIRTTRYSSVLSSYSRRLLLVKELPNTYIEEKDDFTKLLKKYCQYGREPLVFINTETSNSKLLTTLFSQTNRDTFAIDFININAVTQTALKNIMKRVSTILNTKVGYMLNITQNRIDEVLSNSIGDVRSALLNLIFYSLKVEHKSENECNVREETLGLLHAIGRVINPKKNVNGCSWQFVHNPDDLASCFHTQANTFIRFVHENYMNTIGSNLDSVAMAVDVISLADVLSSEWKDNDIHKLALSYCVRGVMIANKKPVSQWNPVRKPASFEFNIQRNYAAAEFQWYKKYISPKLEKQTDVEELSESFIEEIVD